MKFTGMTRRVDELGRIVLPIEIRRSMELATGDLVKIYVEDQSIILKKAQDSCALCGSARELTEFRGHLVCAACRRELREIP